MLAALIRCTVLVLLLAGAGAAPAQNASPHAIDIPSWFAETFLDFREDVADAARENKRLLVYFGQDGCPYCKLLMQTTSMLAFSSGSEKARGVLADPDRNVSSLHGRELGRGAGRAVPHPVDRHDRRRGPRGRQPASVPGGRLGLMAE